MHFFRNLGVTVGVFSGIALTGYAVTEAVLDADPEALLGTIPMCVLATVMVTGLSGLVGVILDCCIKELNNLCCEAEEEAEAAQDCCTYRA